MGDDTDRCTCSAARIESYRAKLSGPMLDRIDMHVHLSRISTQELQQEGEVGEPSEQVRSRVKLVRQQQQRRQQKLNTQLSGKALEQYCYLDYVTKEFLANASERLCLSARAYHRIIRLARTIADIDGSESIQKSHIAEAIGYRSLDRR